VNNENVDKLYRLKENDTITFFREDYLEPDVDKKYSILYESENLLIVNKSGNIPVHPAGRYHDNTLLSIILEEKKYSQLNVVHRLDRETSGIQIFAKNRETATVIQKEFECRNISKQYIVYIHGTFPKSIHAKGFISNDKNSLIRKKKAFNYLKTVGSEDCDTIFHLLKQLNGYSKILAFPITGRTHQIRATLRSLGYPVYGDKLYGPDENIFLKFIEDGESYQDLKRQALHAFMIQIPSSKFYPNLTIIAEEPQELKEIEENFSI
jgi:RluA family pseudouridine synthase